MLKRKARVEPSRAELLEAILVKNPLVKESQRKGTSLRLTAPLKSNAVRKLLAPRSAPTRSFELDAVGIWVWDRIDNRTTVAALIGDFALHHHVAPREAENSLAVFLRTLLQRNLITLVRG